MGIELIVRPLDAATNHEDWDRFARLELGPSGVGVSSTDALLRRDLLELVGSGGESGDDMQAYLGEIEQAAAMSGRFGVFEPGRFRLEVDEGPDAGAEYGLTREMVTVGRHRRQDDFHFAIHEIASAPRHFRLRWQPSTGGYVVESERHANPLYVNGEPFAEESHGRRPLRSGDLLQLGKTTIEVLSTRPACGCDVVPGRCPFLASRHGFCAVCADEHAHRHCSLCGTIVTRGRQDRCGPCRNGPPAKQRLRSTPRPVPSPAPKLRWGEDDPGVYGDPVPDLQEKEAEEVRWVARSPAGVPELCRSLREEFHLPEFEVSDPPDPRVTADTQTASAANSEMAVYIDWMLYLQPVNSYLTPPETNFEIRLEIPPGRQDLEQRFTTVLTAILGTTPRETSRGKCRTFSWSG